MSFLHPFCISKMLISLLECMAGTTGLEPATSAVTGQHSNQLNYVPFKLCELPAEALHLAVGTARSLSG